MRQNIQRHGKRPAPSPATDKQRLFAEGFGQVQAEMRRKKWMRTRAIREAIREAKELFDDQMEGYAE